MHLWHRDGLGQDSELVRVRRRALLITLSLTAATLVALCLAVLLLHERRASLLVIADQPDAAVILNGSQVPTPVGHLIKNLRPDTYSVTVSKNGFAPQPSYQMVQLRAGKTASVSFVLVPLRKLEIPPTELPPSQATAPRNASKKGF